MKFLKAAWDAIGSEFGSRHTQYEMFYAGARFVTCGHSFRTFDWNDATGAGRVAACPPTICRANWRGCKHDRRMPARSAGDA